MSKNKHMKPSADVHLDKHEKVNNAGMWFIITAGILLLSIVVVVGTFWVNEYSERIRFVAINTMSVVGMALIALQVYIYRKQWDVMERQLKATEKAADAAYVGQRAYVGIADLTMSSAGMSANAQLIVGVVPTLHVTWHNGGNTPARNFRAIPYLVFGDKPERKGFFIDDDDSDISGSFLPAGKDVTVQYPQQETGFPPVTQQMLNDLNSGKKRLYVMVIGVYIDYADKSRWFETGAIYKPYDGSFTELHEYNKQE